MEEWKCIPTAAFSGHFDPSYQYFSIPAFLERLGDSLGF